MSEPRPTIRLAENGPLLVKGLERLVDPRDAEPERPGPAIALCRCGASATKPYCDGAHTAAGFRGDREGGGPRDARRDYVGGELTVHDNRAICSHAAVCVERLPAVFRREGRPWIAPDEASRDEVVAVVEACPSGALSHSIDGVERRDRERAPAVRIVPGGPYAVEGGVELEGAEWGAGASHEHYELCRCGHSRNKPFCDGAHGEVAFDEDA